MLLYMFLYIFIQDIIIQMIKSLELSPGCFLFRRFLFFNFPLALRLTIASLF